MALGALYRGNKACSMCLGDLPTGSSVNRLYCDACAKRRRIVSYLRAAQTVADEIRDDGMVRQIEGLIVRTGVSKSVPS